MGYNPEKHHRRSIRYPYHNYTGPGTYFITICTQQRKQVFGSISGGVMAYNPAGEIARKSWLDICTAKQVQMDAWILMPDHFHGILHIHLFPGCKPKPLGRFVGAFKTTSTRQINQMNQTPGQQLWQRNYRDRVVRNRDELARIRSYIHNNPRNWDHAPVA